MILVTLVPVNFLLVSPLKVEGFSDMGDFMVLIFFITLGLTVRVYKEKNKELQKQIEQLNKENEELTIKIDEVVDYYRSR
ncbi:hypothetical protein KO561_14300 [Radiobacillus kanasensis]|uniref:hypothetical protein n=1 Tax=Radiobacillus kanasensis TaxID=2844358 RepID=UPI001E3788B0|nr:hypothetical protein [Radiobacillus kanasensis]UFT98365.1 hypothetical protein KO561_14300 [Radiobacillus kanasensis]